MTRVRISTTVDAKALDEARRLVNGRDGQMLDAAMRALIEKLATEAESKALDSWPYASDLDLRMPDALADDRDALPYDGDVPADVVALARHRRRRGV
jgi:hypothetical protein